jgi:drug/metabolite transporter (DMT)-like permease
VKLFRRGQKPHEHTNPLDPDYEPPAPPGEKRRNRVTLALIILSVGLAAVAQLTLKYGMAQVGFIRGSELSSPVGTLVRIFREPIVWGGLAMFGISALFWMVALSRTSLSFAYPFAAMTYVLILLFDWLVLREPVVALRWLGVAFIIVGLILVSRTGEDGEPPPGQEDRAAVSGGR